MRLKKAGLTFAGATAAVAVMTMAASPAWACNDRDPALKLTSVCGNAGQPDWMVSNPNKWGAVPFTWSDDKGLHSGEKLSAPAGGSVALPTHANEITVVAYRPDQRNLPVWQNHGAKATAHCATPKPSETPTQKPPSDEATPTPTASSKTPVVTPPSGEAGPATPVHAQPVFTG